MAKRKKYANKKARALSSLFQVDDTRKRRPNRFTAFVGTLLLLLMGVGGYAAMAPGRQSSQTTISGSGHDTYVGSLPSNPNVALVDSVKAMAESGGVGVSENVILTLGGASINGGGSAIAKFTGAGTFSFKSGAGNISVSSTSSGSGQSQFAVIQDDSTIYLQVNPTVLPPTYANKRWASINPSNSGSDATLYILLADPSELVGLLRMIDSGAKEIKTGALSGIPVTEYSATLSVASAKKLLGSYHSFMIPLLDSLSNSILDFDVVLDQTGRVREIGLTMGLSNSSSSSSTTVAKGLNLQVSASVTITVTGFGMPLDVTVPPSAYVMDFETYQSYQTANTKHS